MRKYMLLLLLLIPIIFISGCIEPSPDKEKACINSGGRVGTFMCCLSAGDFPNNCLIGACGCSPVNSHEVKVCSCPYDKCFDGYQCIEKLDCRTRRCPEGQECVPSLVIGEYICMSTSEKCSSNSDCVPAQCCHPTSCVSKSKTPDCSGIMCTQECQSGTMDCGAGICVCENEECKVKWMHGFEVKTSECLGGQGNIKNELGFFPVKIKSVSYENRHLTVVVSLEENCCGVEFDGYFETMRTDNDIQTVKLYTKSAQVGAACTCICPYEQTFDLDIVDDSFNIDWYFNGELTDSTSWSK